ncbi:hypothetical protein Chro_3400 [Chroococcidiopsis thermalis PCC 7203]|uniref:Uncharacterized protein n=1 Tax=Chroococcidiopsis thermalis (strain PCC 7203) TaxID=251229 RepID=K9U3Q8_CHRTP|nr:hypothetical protein Chro_3400 [Chroococcidiopsis thermalis PCC 7203]
MRSIANWLNNIKLCKNALKTNEFICSNSFQLSEMKIELYNLIVSVKT